MSRELVLTAAQVLTVSERVRTSLREAAKLVFSQRPDLEYLKPVVRVLSTEVARRYLLLDHVLEKILGVEVRRLPRFWRNVARIVVYEVMFRGTGTDKFRWVYQRLSISPSELSRVRCLRPEDVVQDLNQHQRLSILYSVPQWILEKFVEVQVPGLEEFLRKLFDFPVKWIRVNTLKITRSELCRVLRSRYGICVVEDVDLPEMVKVLRYRGNLAKLPEFEKGLYHLQDKASALVCHVAGVRTGTYVIDVTGGPGGKATHAYQLGAYSLALEIAKHRVREVVKMCRRLDFVVDVVRGDARTPPLRLEKFEVVIVDPECSGLGRLWTCPEVKMWLRPGDVRKFVKQQYSILRSVLERVRRGTTVVYSTCTLTREECEDVVRRVVEEGLAEVVEQRPFIGVESPLLRRTQRLYPHLHDTAGFFIAKLVRT